MRRGGRVIRDAGIVDRISICAHQGVEALIGVQSYIVCMEGSNNLPNAFLSIVELSRRYRQASLIF